MTLWDKTAEVLLRVVLFFSGLSVMYLATKIWNHQSSAAVELGLFVLCVGAGMSLFALFGGRK